MTKLATELHALLRGNGFPLSLRTVLRCRSSLGWTFRGSSYCQLIREANMVFRGGSRIFLRGGGGGGRNKIDHCQYIMRIAGEVTQLYTEC